MFLSTYHGKRVVYETERKGSFARVTCTRERTKLRACRPLLARRPAGYHPELVLNRTVHPVRMYTHDCGMLPSGPIEWRFCGRQRPGLLNGSVGHTEIVQGLRVAGDGLTWGWVMATPISSIHSVPLASSLLAMFLRSPFLCLPLLVVSLNLNLSLSSRYLFIYT